MSIFKKNILKIGSLAGAIILISLLQTSFLPKTASSQNKRFADLPELIQQARADNPTAQMILGIWYLEGHQVEKDPGKGIFWFEKAANSGNPDWQYLLGVIFNEGVYIGSGSM